MEFDVLVYTNPLIIVLCLSVGKFIKSAKWCSKIPNDYIPYILVAVAIVSSVLLNGFTTEVVISGFISSAVAIGLHQQGKVLLKNSELGNFISKSFGTNEDEDVEG